MSTRTRKHWSQQPTGAKVHAIMQSGFRGTATEVADRAGISRISAERQLCAMVRAGEGHIYDRLPVKKNGPQPAHYAYGPEPALEPDDDDTGPTASRAHVINQAVREAQRGHATRIILSGIEIWNRATGIDAVALKRLDQAVRT
ncbi:MAG: hypothetical protein H6948_16215 [Zoogloeaceae bacterium]|nr:hypothetical protein [Zoogloeaceae bacterium]